MDGDVKSVLVVDDEPDVVTYLCTLLQEHGFISHSAGDAASGIASARELHPDLVCLDITMPEESGIRFYRRLKEDAELAATPVIVVTAVTGFGGDPEPFRHFLGTRKHVPPPEGFLAKPIDQEEFLRTVSSVLERVGSRVIEPHAPASNSPRQA